MKFWTAMAVYALIALVATFWIEGTLRTAVWILIGGLGLKTIVARKAGW